MSGAGCFLQGLGVLSFVGAVVTFTTIIGPIVFGILAIWFFAYGSAKSQWYECSECGTRLAHKKVTLCPNCKAAFS
jgi:hypothetical protein